ncbi:thioesterase family protein [Nocardia jiangxiensis]|uniref:Thioesterase family protein n=1 Tax=Nocardia jiangxiensis TaxID=282685 RepID=A0ABW6SDF9_9NOCA|nr:hotdog domain-containing protein [Nocardia jiangxiensis]
MNLRPTNTGSARWRLSPNGFRRSRNTPTLARVGDERDASYSTGPQDCVQAAGPGPEWSNKPPVVASYAVIRLCEELCMVALLETMPEGFCSLGTRQHLGHLGPIAVGAQITITARCVRARGRFSSWQVTVRDSHETVGEGRMDFVAVHRPHYEARRLEPKRAALSSALSTA